MRPITVETKEAYLDWVQEWKTEYAIVSRDIRSMRYTIRTYLEPMYIKIPIRTTMVSHIVHVNRHQPEQVIIAKLRKHARTLLNLRAKGKIMSQIAKKHSLEVAQLGNDQDTVVVN